MKKDHDWYLYLVPFEGKDEFKFGKGKGLSDLTRIKTHHSRYPINLMEAYLITGDERSISKLEGVLKADYSTDDYLLSDQEMQDKYPLFLADGYTEIRRNTCLQSMIEHIEFKRSRPASELSELRKKIVLPTRKIKPRKTKTVNRISPIERNQKALNNWLLQLERYFDILEIHKNDISRWEIFTRRHSTVEETEIFLFTTNQLEHKLAPKRKNSEEDFSEMEHEFFRVSIRLISKGKEVGVTSWVISTSSISYPTKNRGVIQINFSKGKTHRGDCDLHSPYYSTILDKWNSLFKGMKEKQLDESKRALIEEIRENESSSWTWSHFANGKQEEDHYTKYIETFFQ